MHKYYFRGRRVPRYYEWLAKGICTHSVNQERRVHIESTDRYCLRTLLFVLLCRGDVSIRYLYNGIEQMACLKSDRSKNPLRRMVNKLLSPYVVGFEANEKSLTIMDIISCGSDANELKIGCRAIFYDQCLDELFSKEFIRLLDEKLSSYCAALNISVIYKLHPYQKRPSLPSLYSRSKVFAGDNDFDIAISVYSTAVIERTIPFLFVLAVGSEGYFVDRNSEKLARFYKANGVPHKIF